MRDDKFIRIPGLNPYPSETTADYSAYSTLKGILGMHNFVLTFLVMTVI